MLQEWPLHFIKIGEIISALSLQLYSHFQVCDGVDDCPFGEDENSEDWFTFEDVFNGSFSKDFVREQLRLWGEEYLGSNNGNGTLEEEMGSICVKTSSKIFLLYTILVSTVVALVLLIPASCLVNMI